jgi:hypothetical protein
VEETKTIDPAPKDISAEEEIDHVIVRLYATLSLSNLWQIGTIRVE